jgi:hypothetical protein
MKEMEEEFYRFNRRKEVSTGIKTNIFRAPQSMHFQVAAHTVATLWNFDLQLFLSPFLFCN